MLTDDLSSRRMIVSVAKGELVGGCPTARNNLQPEQYHRKGKEWKRAACGGKDISTGKLAG